MMYMYTCVISYKYTCMHLWCVYIPMPHSAAAHPLNHGYDPYFKRNQRLLLEPNLLDWTSNPYLDFESWTLWSSAICSGKFPLVCKHHQNNWQEIPVPSLIPRETHQKRSTCQFHQQLPPQLPPRKCQQWHCIFRPLVCPTCSSDQAPGLMATLTLEPRFEDLNIVSGVQKASEKLEVWQSFRGFHKCGYPKWLV